MKRIGNLWPQIVDFANLERAACSAQRGKRWQENVLAFNFDRANELMQLQRELTRQIYQPGSYRTFHIYEPKKRLISAAPYRDRVVHHALCNTIAPIRLTATGTTRPTTTTTSVFVSSCCLPARFCARVGRKRLRQACLSRPMCVPASPATASENQRERIQSSRHTAEKPDALSMSGAMVANSCSNIFSSCSFNRK